MIRDSSGAASVLAIAVDASAEVLARRSLDESLLRDFLTGLPNRYALQNHYDSHRCKSPHVLICINLKKFRRVNERFGFAIGDHVLREVASRLRGEAKVGETVARHSGVDFLLLIEAHLNKEQTMLRARKIIDAVEKPLHLQGITLSLRCSIGISQATEQPHSFHELLRQAKVASHAAHDTHAERVSLYSKSADEVARLRFDRSAQLRSALSRGEVITHFQSIIDVLTNRVIGAECLARWQVAEDQWICPSVFIPIAEDYGLIDELGLQVFARSCAFAVRINSNAAEMLVVSVNVSPLQLSNGDFPLQLAQIIKQSGVRPEMLRLEITESQVLHTDAALAVLHSLVDGLGLQCVIDDFGAGYSNLKRLIGLPVCGIKIDRPIVAMDKASSRQLVAAITTMARAMDIHVTAEGVEDINTLDALRSIRCNSYQGFLFSEALAEHKFVERHTSQWNRPNGKQATLLVHSGED